MHIKIGEKDVVQVFRFHFLHPTFLLHKQLCCYDNAMIVFQVKLHEDINLLKLET